ncbi:FCD domain-containing protein [Rhodovibrio salinarum]|uniref:GntR family transcriptional regulator n=1 Tax=Rhodovibrio salinarum TaxID=1087 RepID=A0A934V274_9PROT|nr:FCD domain-containing protein [Rhodovibrio salinarum]MBK1699115.1 GntR family transcriptional regulator [Rhodovibrio salinarum]
MKKYKIERKTLSEQVAERLEQEIREGTYKAGDQLPSEREMMEQFGVGRPAVREALFYLQKLGFVAINSGTRPRVIKPTSDAVLPRLSGVVQQLLEDPNGQTSLQDARVLFEVAVARHAAQQGTSADHAALRDALETNLHNIGDDPAFKRSDVAFHAALAKVTDNPIVVAVHDALSTLLDDQRAHALQRPGEDRIASEAHREIVEAIERGDPDAAEDAMRRHLQHHYGTYRTLKEGGPQTDSPG